MRFLMVSGLLILGSCSQPPPENLSGSELKSRIQAAYEEYRDDFPDVEPISPSELAALQAEDRAIVVDVREKDERAVSMIPGAMTQEEFESNRDVYADRTVVTYCTIGYRSGVYAEELREEGMDVRNLAGSILSWVAEGNPVVDPSGKETKRVHTYGAEWALVPEGYEAVY